MRTVCKIGRDSRFPDFSAAADYLRNALATLPGQIQLDATRELAKAKVELLERFLAGLEEEAKPGLY
jgi:uncharacterized protein